MSAVLLNKDFFHNFCEVLDLCCQCSCTSPPSLPSLSCPPCPRSASNPSSLHDRDEIVLRLQTLIDEIAKDSTRNPQLYTALLLIAEEIFPYFAFDQNDCAKIFQRVFDLCERITDEGTSLFVDLLLATRIKMFCVLVTNGFFSEDHCHRWYLCDQWLRFFHQLTETKISRVIIEDEFDPLLLPRQPGHNHFTRVPLLRQICRLHALVLTYFHTQTRLLSAKGAVCRMYLIENTWTYRCFYQPRPPSSDPPFLHINNNKSKKKKDQSAVTNKADPTPLTAKVCSVCCSSDGELPIAQSRFPLTVPQICCLPA
jgi:hypothetical protein